MAERIEGLEHQLGPEAEPANPIRHVAAFAMLCACLLLLQFVLSLWVVVAESAWVGPPAAMFAVPLSLLSGVCCLNASVLCRWGRVRDSLTSAIVFFIFGALGCIFGVVLLSFMHSSSFMRSSGWDDLFSYEGGGGPRARLLGIVCVLVGLGVLCGGLGLWVNRGAYQRWRAKIEHRTQRGQGPN
jgi:hypothetical protein